MEFSRRRLGTVPSQPIATQRSLHKVPGTRVEQKPKVSLFSN